MNYLVVWGPRTEAMLAAVWLRAPDQLAVTLAAGMIDTSLGYDPLKFGESRTSTVHRIAFCLPLGVEYEVVEDDKIVIVQGVFSVG